MTPSDMVAQGIARMMLETPFEFLPVVAAGFSTALSMMSADEWLKIEEYMTAPEPASPAQNRAQAAMLEWLRAERENGLRQKFKRQTSNG